MTYFYVRALYVMGQPPVLHALGDQKGSVTRDPFEAYKRHRRQFEREFAGSFGRIGHAGKMFAYWLLPHMMPWHEALPIAQITPPERVCVLTEEYGWQKVDLVLPPGQLIIIEQYPHTLPKRLRST